MNHSTMSEMGNGKGQQKRAKLIESLQKGKFSDFEGSKPLISLLKKQRDTILTNNLRDANRIIAKQQKVLRELDEENVRLNVVNTAQNKELRKNQIRVETLTKENLE